jgi:hypothetical protein
MYGDPPVVERMPPLQHRHLFDVLPPGTHPLVPDAQPDADGVGDQQTTARTANAAATIQRRIPVGLVEPDAAKPIATSAAPTAIPPCTCWEARTVNGVGCGSTSNRSCLGSALAAVTLSLSSEGADEVL